MSSVDSGSGQDFDLNIAPIIDCFTVLITYLLVSASFISLKVIEAGVAVSDPNAAAAQPPPPTPPQPPLNAEVFLLKTGAAQLKVTGGPRNLNQLLTQKNLTELKNTVTILKQSYPTFNEISVSAEADVPYSDLLKGIEPLKEVIAKVFIAGTARQ